MSGIVAVFFKQPSEKHERSHDWGKNVKSGTSVSSATVTAVRLDTLADETANVIEGVSTSGNLTNFTVKNGVDQVNYKITLRMTRSDGKIFEDDLLMRVRET